MNIATLPPALTERTVDGYNIAATSRFSDVVGTGPQPTLLVFLRHYG